MKEILQNINWKIVIVAVFLAALISWLFVFDGLSKLKARLHGAGTQSGNGTQNGSGTQVIVNNQNSSSASATATATASVKQGFPLQKGVGTTSKPNSDVKTLQQMANYYLRQDIKEDGAWGPETESAMNILMGTTRRDGYGNKAKWQFKDYIESGSGHPVVTEDKFRRMATNSDSIWATDKRNNLNFDIA